MAGTHGASGLRGRLCVVTGAGRGIGRAVVLRLLDEGADVVAVSRTRRGLDDLADRPGLTVVEGDMTRLSDIGRLAGTVAGLGRPVRAVFPVVGGGPDTTVSASDESDFDLVMALNVKSAFFTVQRMLPFMEPGSAVVLFASIAGRQGGTGSVVYNAAKAAVRSFARTFAAELGPRGIRVNAVSPGPTDTDGFDLFIHGDPDRRRAIEGMSAMGRVGCPEEVAAAAVFLAGDAASYVTGAELVADGGFLAT
ncbi:SDR family NAD(P)-dependent oxidoreductase [Bifidobacterium phasiani]|uniref:SDR family oxidoreductase n=1 Tax=Bifidobacterium phasiani TaxID=2834431 RepID=A0ABS6WAE0_9BIFI|nr:SDR family oxidoreductase [Bifidobacterium phasiani]MBW3083478.1 SDR family oxidoreductase [Bifidobacterium phasiani]